jgi:hypothetical protein
VIVRERGGKFGPGSFSIRKAKLLHSFALVSRRERWCVPMKRRHGMIYMSVSRSRELIIRRHTASMARALIWLKNTSPACAVPGPALATTPPVRISRVTRREGFGTGEGEEWAMRVLIPALSVLGILICADTAKSDPSTTNRDLSASVDPATFTDEATQETEDQIGLDKGKRRDVQRRLTGLGFDTKGSGKFDESTRAVIARWQGARGYPKTGFLNTLQHDALLADSVSAAHASSSGSEKFDDDNPPRRRDGGGAHHHRSGGGPGGLIGGMMGGLFGRR